MSGDAETPSEPSGDAAGKVPRELRGGTGSGGNLINMPEAEEKAAPAAEGN